MILNRSKIMNRSNLAKVDNLGGILTGMEIYKQYLKGDISITPFKKELLNPNSYNLTLSPNIKMYDLSDGPIDFKKKAKTIDKTIPDSGMVLEPGKFYLGSTIESTATDKFIPMIDGRSSGGRLGISVHICAGFGDIGFRGHWTLEITSEIPVIVYPGIEIAQISFYTPYGDINYRYNGRYQEQNDTTQSLSYKNINRDNDIIDDVMIKFLFDTIALDDKYKDNISYYEDYNATLYLLNGELERGGIIYSVLTRKRIGRIFYININGKKEKLYVRPMSKIGDEILYK